MSRPYDTEAEYEYEREYWEEQRLEEFRAHSWSHHWLEYYATVAPPEDDAEAADPDPTDTSK